MIQLYAYYNHGGYKDMYLGSLNDADENKYFISLYKVYEGRLANNPEDKKAEEWRKKLAEWSPLPKITELNEKSPNAYPQGASFVISHAGYKLMLKKLDTGKVLLSLRDIEGPSDEFGRATTFSLIWIADNREDNKKLCTLADYIRRNSASFDKFCSETFNYDSETNALKFSFGEYTTELKRIINSHNNSTVKESHKTVWLYVAPQGPAIKDCIEQQGVQENKIELLYDTSGKEFRIERRYETKHDTPDRTTTPRIPNFGIPTLHLNHEKSLEERVVQLEKEKESLERRVEKLEEIIKNIQSHK